MTLEHSGEVIRFPESMEAPRCPLQKPQSGRYHLVRFIRSNTVLDVFGERFQLPSETAYEYVVATIDVASQTMSVKIDNTVVDQRRYELR